MNKVNYAKISSDNVKLLLLQNRMSVRQLAEKIGIAPTTLNDSLKSKKGIAIDSLIKIADYFHITVNDLCDESFKVYDVSVQNRDDLLVLNKYNHLDSHGKEIVSIIIDKEFERMINENK